MLNVTQRWRTLRPLARAEILAGAWELFSALLFTSAVFPAAFKSPSPAAVFAAGLGLSLALAPRLVSRGRSGPTWAAALRIPLWLLAVAPMLPGADARVLVASCGF